MSNHDVKSNGAPANQKLKPWQRTIDDPDAALYTVGVVAELLEVDPQVVRGYDKRGVVEPGRVKSGHRRYSRREIARLARALELADQGISSPGIERILDLERQLEEERRHTSPSKSHPDTSR